MRMVIAEPFSAGNGDLCNIRHNGDGFTTIVDRNLPYDRQDEICSYSQNRQGGFYDPTPQTWRFLSGCRYRDHHPLCSALTVETRSSLLCA